MTEHLLAKQVQGPLCDLETARALLKEALPDWGWLIARIESERGYVRFPPRLGEVIHRLRIENYPLLYEREHAAGAAIALAVADRDELLKWDAQLRTSSPAQRGKEALELCRSLESVIDEIQWPETPEEVRRAQAAFDSLPADDRAGIVQFWQMILAGSLALFYEYLSVMVHGEKLTSLVVQAKAGSQSAFAKAVQIDKRILVAIPFFSRRWEQAHLEGDVGFLKTIGPRLHAPPYRGKIRHKSLWLTFTVLDDMGLLDDFAHDPLLDFCNDVGVGGRPSRIEDVKNLSRRLAEFRVFRDRGMVIESTP